MAPIEEGSIILRREILVGEKDVIHRLRVRVLSEQGKGAVQIEGGGIGVGQIRGRTLLPDGQEIPFRDGDDIHSKSYVEFRNLKVNRAEITAPGLTSNCLVDLEWREPLADPVTKVLKARSWSLVGFYPTETLEIQILKGVPFAWIITGATALRPEVLQEQGGRVIRYSRLPALRGLPYILDTARDIPRIRIYNIPNHLKAVASKPPSEFWTVAAVNVFAPYRIPDCSQSGPLMAFFHELMEGMPDGNQARARFLTDRLKKAIRNLSAETWEEANGFKGDLPELRLRPNQYASYRNNPVYRMELAVWRKACGVHELINLTLALLREAKVPVEVVRTTDNRATLINFEIKDPEQFDITLLQIREEEKTPLWLFPASRWSASGMVHEAYMGNRGLGYDLGSSKVRSLLIPEDPPKANLTQLRVNILPGSSEDEWRWESTLRGVAAHDQRGVLAPLSPSARSRRVKGDFQWGRPNVLVKSIAFDNLMEPDLELRTRLEGIARSSRFDAQGIEPFPGASDWLTLNRDLPETRREILYFGHPRRIEADCFIDIPSGQAPVLPPDLIGQNALGVITWSNLSSESGRLHLRLTAELQVSALVPSPEIIRQVKAYLGWWQEALSRRVYWEGK